MAENHDSCTCSASRHASVAQTLDELEFERGLWYAALIGDVEKLELLLAKGKNPDMTDNAGYTALHYAARNGHLEICKILLRAGSCVNARTKSCLSTPLHRAAYCGKLDVVRLLIYQPNCSIIVQDVDGKTCLHKAVEKKHWDIVNLLASHAPTLIQICDKNGRPPFYYIDDSNILKDIHDNLKIKAS